MTTAFLHGVQVVEIDTGVRPIQTGRSSVIGLVGTAPDAATGSRASLIVSTPGENTGIQYTALSTGTEGNAISVHYSDPGTNSAQLQITVQSKAIKVSLATDATGVIITTAGQLVDALNGNPNIGQIVEVELSQGSDGTGVLGPMRGPQTLFGGENDPFPLNTPVLVAGNQLQAAKLDAFGNGAGTLPAAMRGIFDQHGAAIVVVRVAENVDASDLERLANLSLDHQEQPFARINQTQITRDDSVAMAAAFRNLDGSLGGRIFALGGVNKGAYVGFRANGDLIFRCVDGSTDISRSAYLLVPAASAPSGSGTLIWEFAKDVETENFSVRAWWEPLGGEFAELNGTTNTVQSNTWSGTTSGGYMVPETDQAVRDEVNDRVPAGEAISPLRFYFRQTIPVGINPADAAGLPELDAETIANVIGGLDENTDKRTGIQALRDAEAEAKLTPKVLIAPQFSQNAAVAQALLSVADELRAVAIIDGPDATVKQAIDTATELTHKRAFMVDYWPRVFDPTRAEEVTEPPSARVAGLISKVDAEKGFHWSPSNQVINGVLGTSRPCDFSLQNRNTTGQILNEAGVAVIANVNGWRLMGNRTTSIDPLWVYLPVRRTADMIYEAIEQGHQWALDRPFSAQLIRDLRDGVATYLRQLQARGVILGGNVWINSEFNTAADLQAGRLTIGFDFEPPAPAEHLIFRAERNGTYYDELIRQVAAV